MLPAFPLPGKTINDVTVLDGVRIVQEVFIGCVFLISGLTLDPQALKKLSYRRLAYALLYSIIAMLFVTPLIGFAFNKMPLQPIEFDYGLCIWVAMPTTLGVGVALVRQCAGNDSLGTVITVFSNVLAIFIVPPMLKLLFLNVDRGTAGSDSSLTFSVNVDIPDLLVKLVVTILAPAILGVIIRNTWKAAETFSVKYKQQLSIFSTSLLACIIYFNISAARDSLLQTPGGMIASLIAIVSATYVFFQLLNLFLVHYVFKYDPFDSVALVILSSQKSAPVAMTIISYITLVTTQQGLLAIPSIIGQLAQIFIGSALAPFIARKVKALMNSQKEDHHLPAVRAASVQNTQDLHDESLSNSTEGARDSVVLAVGSPSTMTMSLQR
jgi:sodium/bile acid cotransporter 7